VAGRDDWPLFFFENVCTLKFFCTFADEENEINLNNYVFNLAKPSRTEHA
jgi:hypothetical protein